MAEHSFGSIRDIVAEIVIEHHFEDHITEKCFNYPNNSQNHKTLRWELGAIVSEKEKCPKNPSDCQHSQMPIKRWNQAQYGWYKIEDNRVTGEHE